jgi:hypothetical protein
MGLSSWKDRWKDKENIKFTEDGILIQKESEKFLKEKETSLYRTRKPFALINAKQASHQPKPVKLIPK